MKIFLVGIAILAIVILVIVFSITQTKKGNEIEIGAILPLTGGNAQWGIAPKKGAEMAISEINAHGGINGRKLVLSVEDGQCDPKVGVSAFNKLISTKNIKLIMGEVCSSVTLAMAPIAEKNHILLISPASTNPDISKAGEYIFRVIPSDSYRGAVFAEYVYSDQNKRNIAILYINNEGGVGNRTSFQQRFSELGEKIVLEESYDQNATDMRTQLSKIKSSNADALVVVSYLGDTALVLKQAKELGLKLPMYFQTEAVEDPNVLKASGGSAEGVTYILAAPAEGDIPKLFQNNYVKNYGIKPELYAAEGYDIIFLMSKAIAETKSLDTSVIKDYLSNVKGYQGASGVITFDNNGDVQKPMAIKVIKNGIPTILKQL